VVVKKRITIKKGRGKAMDIAPLPEPYLTIGHITLGIFVALWMWGEFAPRKR
jgi:hypothetical protein